MTLVKAVTDEALEPGVDIEERHGCICVGSLLEEKLSYEFGGKSKSEAIVLAIKPYPFMRYGHWHSDLESRGFYVPNCNIDGKNVTASSTDGLFCYSVEGTYIGFSSFWYNYWQPIHPKGIRSLCGTFTAVEKNNYPKWLQLEKKSKQLFACKAIILISEGSYREFESETHEFCVSFGS